MTNTIDTQLKELRAKYESLIEEVFGNSIMPSMKLNLVMHLEDLSRTSLETVQRETALAILKDLDTKLYSSGEDKYIISSKHAHDLWLKYVSDQPKEVSE